MMETCHHLQDSLVDVEFKALEGRGQVRCIQTALGMEFQMPSSKGCLSSGFVHYREGPRLPRLS